jgi:hypothetical protein
MTEANYIFSVNNVLHIEEDSEKQYIVISPNLLDARNNFNDPNIRSQLRVVGGTWTEEITTSKILPQDDNQGYPNKQLTFGNSNTHEIHLGNKFHLLNSNTDVILNGSNFTIGNQDTVYTISSSNLSINNNIELLSDDLAVKVDSLSIVSSNNYQHKTPLFDLNDGIVTASNSNVLLMNGKVEIDSNNMLVDINNYNLNDILKVNSSNSFELTTENVLLSNTNLSIVNSNMSLSSSNFDISMTNFDIVADDMSIIADTVNIDNKILIDSSNVITNISSNIVNATNIIKNETANYSVKTTNNMNLDSTSTMNVHANTIDIDADTSLNINSIFNIQDTSSISLLPTNLITTSTNSTNTTDTYVLSSSVKEEHDTPVLTVNADMDNAYLSVKKQDGTCVMKSQNSITQNTTHLYTTAALSHTLNTALYEVNGSSDKSYLKMNKSSGEIQVGTANTVKTDVLAKTLNVTTTTQEKHTANLFEVNSSSSAGYLKIDKNNSSIQVGTSSTAVSTLEANNIKLNTVNDSANLLINKQQNKVVINENRESQSTFNGNSIVLGSSSLTSTTINGSNITFNGTLIPSLDSTFDIGTPSNKVKDIYVSDNSIWLGDDHKFEVTDGKLRFKKRNRNVLPTGLRSVNNVTIINPVTGLPKDVNEFTLGDLDTIRKQNGVASGNINELFTDDDFEDNTPGLTWIDGANGINDIYYSKGNVGIGTENPQVLLHINGTDSIKLPVGTTYERPVATGVEHAGYIRYNTDTEQFEGFGAGNKWGTLGGVVDVDQDTLIKAETNAGDDNDELQFITAGEHRMIIKSDGVVGIGTQEPTHKLHIVGDTRIEGNLIVNGETRIIDTDTSTSEQLVVTNDGTGPAVIVNQIGSQPIMDIQDSSQSVLFIEDGGNVGIKTVDPLVSLHVNTTDSIKIPVGTTAERPVATGVEHAGYIRYNTDTNQFEGFGAGNSWGTLGGVVDVDQDTYIKAESNANGDNDELWFYTDGEQRMIITSDGKIGLNTSNPNYNVDIKGDINYYDGTLTSNGVDVFQEFRENLRSGTLYVTPDEDNNSLTLGEDGLDEIGITANKINIGTANSVTTILGELIAYSTGSMSNVVINTTQQETSSFYINNVGTDIAMLVKQDNILNCNMDIARFVTNEDCNTAFRIDSDGKTGIGIYGDSNIEAWLHVNKKDQYDIVTPMVRVDDKENDTTPFIITADGKVGINTTEPVSDLEIDGETVTNRLVAGTISGALVLPEDAILEWDFRDEGTDVVNYSSTSNMLFSGYMVNFNKKIIDVDSPYTGYLDRSLMLWYKFDETNSATITNHANTMDNSYQNPDDITSSSLIQDIPVLKRIRGSFNTYYVYVDTEVILPNGKAYMYPNQTDALTLLEKIQDIFTFNIYVRIEDTTLPSISLFSIKQNDITTILNISIVEGGIIKYQLKDTIIYSVTPIEELKDTNVIVTMNYLEESNSTIMEIYLNGFKDIEHTVVDFKPNFVVDNVGVKFASDITVDKSPVFLKDIKLFERLLSQAEIYGLNDRDEEGKVNRNIKVNPESDYLMDVDGNARVSESLVLNNGLASKIFFASGGVLFMDTNNQTTCSLGVNIKWKNNLSSYVDIQTFIFRLTCNFHACTSHPDNALSYRSFSAFINPKDDPVNLEYPKLITTTENSDTVSSSMGLQDTILQRSSATSMMLLIKFKNRDNVYNSMRGYLECNFLASSELGVFEFETIYDIEGTGFVF